MPVTLDGTTGIALTGNAGLTQNGNGTISFTSSLAVTGGGTGLTNVGASGNVLTSNGSYWTSSAPTVNLNTQTTGTINLRSQVTDTLQVANGGTGLTAVGTSGNVLTSNGTSWVSQAAPPSSPTLTAVASGTIPGGAPVIINLDGTVSAVTGASNSSLGATINGSYAGTFDEVQQKVVVAYITSSGAAAVVLGTVNADSTISFGAPITFEASGAQQVYDVKYHPAQQKFVVAYTVSGNIHAGIVGNVSGSSVTFGSRVTYFSGSGLYYTTILYEPVSQNMIFTYCSSTGGNYPGFRAATISGTSISFGNTTEITAAGTNTRLGVMAYDSVNQKIVVAHSNQYQYITLHVMTVSGTSISFGDMTSVDDPVYGSIRETGTQVAITYHTASGKIIFAVKDYNSPNKMIAYPATVSGTNITVTYTRGTVENAGNVNDGLILVYDTSIQKFVLSYRYIDYGTGTGVTVGATVTGNYSGSTFTFDAPVNAAISTQYPPKLFYSTSLQKSIYLPTNNSATFYGLILISGARTNLRANNFIGFATQSYTNGQSALIHIKGAVNSLVSNLTAAIAYYVSANGSLNTTGFTTSPNTSVVYAGIAVASNKIIVRG